MKTSKLNEHKIGVIGLGKLGLCLAGVVGNRYETIGVDINKSLVDTINKGACPYDEPMLWPTLINAHFTATTDYRRLDICDVIFCVVNTPSLPDGRFSNDKIYSAISATFANDYKHDNVLTAKDKWSDEFKRLFVVVSTVMPGSCEMFKMRLPQNTKLCYNPEFIALGNVIDGLVNPDFVLIGEEDKQAGDKLEQIYSHCTCSPIKRMDMKSAEIAKIALNSYITMKISFANSLSEICEREHADTNKILNAIGSDSRIGNKYFHAGSAYGGPCFPRDNKAFSQFAKDMPNYSELTDKINEHQTERLYNKIVFRLGNVTGKLISLIGTAYKNNTPINEESAAKKISDCLLQNGAIIELDTISEQSNLAVFLLPNCNKYTAAIQYAKQNKISMIDLWGDK